MSSDDMIELRDGAETVFVRPQAEAQLIVRLRVRYGRRVAGPDVYWLDGRVLADVMDKRVLSVESLPIPVPTTRHAVIRALITGLNEPVVLHRSPISNAARPWALIEGTATYFPDDRIVRVLEVLFPGIPEEVTP